MVQDSPGSRRGLGSAQAAEEGSAGAPMAAEQQAVLEVTLFQRSFVSEELVLELEDGRLRFVSRNP